MDIDYAVSFTAFITFAALAIALYANIMQLPAATGLEAAADSITASVKGYLLGDVYEVPVRFQSSGAASGKTLYFNFTWEPGENGENSSRVYAGTALLPCKVEGNALHWQADLHDGWNDFSLRFANVAGAKNCSGTYDTTNETATIPWAQVKRSMLLQPRVDSMVALGYEPFKSSLAANRDFRVEVNSSGVETTFGKSLPTRSDVMRRSISAQAFESGGNATVAVFVW